jgi:tetratricopeptide (TPR) repeat protein
MVSWRKLDAARGALGRQLILVLPVFLPLLVPAASAELLSNLAGQEASPNDFRSRLAAAQKLFDAGQWEQAARLTAGPSDQPPEFDFLAGMALAKLERWDESRRAFEAGRRKSPRDPRFLVELAGVNYKQNNFAAAKRQLRAALRLDPRDRYTREFLGTIYFLEGNLEAALQFWNPIDKPRLRNVAVQPPPRLQQVVLTHALDFNPPQVLTVDALLTTNARLDLLGIFPHRRFELAPDSAATYDARLHAVERNGWGDSKLEGAISLLSGLPYETVYPEYYNIGRRAINFTSLLRWDSEKRRASGDFVTPLMANPAVRLRVYFDGRNENWNLSNTFFAAGRPPTDLNLRRIAGGTELRSVVNGRWSWSTGIEVVHRSFRNLPLATSATGAPFFTDGTSLRYWLRLDRSLFRLPEHRLIIDSSAEAHLGRTFAAGLQSFGSARGSLHSRWLPQAKGDDYEMQATLRTGDTLGLVPFDELFQLGVERDDDLWLRGHTGTRDGRKGAAPLGRRYLLANWEMDKNVYANGFFTVKVGPFLDNGAIADSSGLFGSQRWLWDTGAQCKLGILGSIQVALIYGRDLRGGRNVFYGTVLP